MVKRDCLGPWRLIDLSSIARTHVMKKKEKKKKPTNSHTLSSDLTCTMARALPTPTPISTRTLNKYKNTQNPWGPHRWNAGRGLPGPGRETEGWADVGRPQPTAFRAVGPARRRPGGAGAGRPPAGIGHAVATPRALTRPPASAGHAPPDKFVFREPRLGGAGSARPKLWLAARGPPSPGGRRVYQPAPPRPSEPRVWKGGSLPCPPFLWKWKLLWSCTQSGEAGCAPPSCRFLPPNSTSPGPPFLITTDNLALGLLLLQV